MKLFAKCFLILIMVAAFATATVYGDDSGDASFRKSPAVDVRAVLLDITKESDAQFEIFIANPILNEPVSLEGEAIFRIPPGMSIYSSYGGGGGASGAYQIGLPTVQAGNNAVVTFYARSQSVGQHAVHMNLTYWPTGNPGLAKEINSTFPINVKEVSPTGVPDAILEDTKVSVDEDTATVIESELSSNDSFVSRSDNPLGWSNWSFLTVIGFLFIAMIFVGMLVYKYLKSRLEDDF